MIDSCRGGLFRDPWADQTKEIHRRVPEQTPWSSHSLELEVLHYIVLYSTLLYSTRLYCTLSYYTHLYYAMLCYAMLCYAMLCYAMLCYAMLCQGPGLRRSTLWILPGSGCQGWGFGCPTTQKTWLCMGHTNIMQKPWRSQKYRPCPGGLGLLQVLELWKYLSHTS